ncbi:hypothetical protein RB597_003547 [Gaeumannomyces tritici]
MEAYSEKEKLYTLPEAGTIYVETSGFEELKRQPCDSCIVEFLGLNPGPSTALGDGVSEVRQPFNNHVVLRLQVKGAPVGVTLKGKYVLAKGVRCSPEVARMPSSRTYLAAKPVHYSSPSKSATAAFWFEVTDGTTIKDFLDAADPPGDETKGLFPFSYVDAPPFYGSPNTQVGCRDFLAQWFCVLHSNGLVKWQCHQAWYPGRGVCKPDGVQTFASIMQYVYNTVLVGDVDQPNLQRLPIPKAHFSHHKRRLECAGEELPYHSGEPAAATKKDDSAKEAERPCKKSKQH